MSVPRVVKRRLHQAENFHESLKLGRKQGTRRKYGTLLNQFIRIPKSYHSKRI